jgi:hypothetical protein
MKRLILIIALSASTLPMEVWMAEAACPNESYQCTFTFEDGDCCQRVVSLPGIQPKVEGQVPSWEPFPGGTDCGIRKEQYLLIPCFGVEGSTCGTKQATPCV